MLEKFTYTNHLGETLEFGKDCLFVNENDLRDFAWDIINKNDRISGFKKGIVSKTIPIVLKCDSESEGLRLRNRLFEVFEKDVIAKKHGKIHIGKYYLRCYITGTSKTQYLTNKNYMVVSATVQTDVAEWIKETTIECEMPSLDDTYYLDSNYDYEIDYQNQFVSASITNEGLVPSNFILEIKGYVVNPTLYICGHKYSVNTTVKAGETLVIDSLNKTIVLNKGSESVNCFMDRGKGSYIFEKIPNGVCTISSPNENLKFTLTLFEERSEPKWI